MCVKDITVTLVRLLVLVYELLINARTRMALKFLEFLYI